MPIASPVTKSKNTVLLNEIDSQKIISNYKDQYGIDVKRFFEGIPKIGIYECLDTHYRFFYPYTLMGDGKLYEDLQNEENYYSKWKWEYKIAQKFINKDDHVLDVGCGSGFFLESQKSKTHNLYGLEFNDEAVRKCKEKNINIVQQFIEQHADSNTEKYDVATSFQVLEHVHDIHSFINSNLKVLKKGGKLIIGVPNSNPYLYKYDTMHTLNLPPHHMGLWNKKAFKSLPNYFNMKLESVFIEPLYDIEYWCMINLSHLLNKELTKRIALPHLVKYALIKTIGNFIEGRNIVAVYSKN